LVIKRKETNRGYNIVYGEWNTKYPDRVKQGAAFSIVDLIFKNTQRATGLYTLVG